MINNFVDYRLTHKILLEYQSAIAHLENNTTALDFFSAKVNVVVYNASIQALRIGADKLFMEMREFENRYEPTI